MRLKLYYYYFQLYISLRGPTEEKRKIMVMMKENIEDYLQDNPSCTVKELKRYFGTAKSMEDSVEHFCEEKKTINQRIWKTIFWTLLGLLILFLVFFFVLYLVQQITIPTYLS